MASISVLDELRRDQSSQEYWWYDAEGRLGLRLLMVVINGRLHEVERLSKQVTFGESVDRLDVGWAWYDGTD